MAVDMDGLGKGRIWGDLDERKQKKNLSTLYENNLFSIKISK